jgi:hypothetical protein
MKFRQKLLLGTLIVTFLTFAAIKLHATAWHKPANSQIWTPGCVASVPRSWGTFRGASTQSGLAFEDNAGTLRFLTNIPCDGAPVVALEIRRTAAAPPADQN